MPHASVNSKLFSRTLKIAVLAVVFSFFLVGQANAGMSPEDVGSSRTSFTNAIIEKSPGTEAKIQQSSLKRTLEKIKDWTIDKLWKELMKSSAIAYKAALKNFLDTLAYDMATYLATGDKGQLPMFETQGWGGYLANVADNAAGAFIETLGKENGFARFNLCTPNLGVMLRINLGLMRAQRPRKPPCTFTEMTKNWSQSLRDRNFLPKFQDMFNPWSNDLGIALTVHSGIETEVSRKINEAIKEREEGAGFKAVKESIGGYIKTPARSVLNAADETFKKSSDNLFVYTGQTVADSIDIFLNTLIGKLIQKWLTQGLVSKFPSLTSKLDSLTNPEGQNPNEGAAGARNRMRSIVEPNFRVRADYDILADLATCPDPNKAGPANCVIDEKFRQAIEKKLTVGQALRQGYLNGNGIFGFTSDGLEPKFNEGYSYRSLVILRKYRIIPVGWEAAAQKIKDLQGQGAGKVDGTKNLNDLAACYSETDDYQGYFASWCEGLLDPDWVLKAPQNFCKREGAGEEIISEEVTGQGAGSSLAVLRDDTYCADEQSCIKEKADGSCQLYGYCTEERRTWDFNGQSCAPRFNTCQTFSDQSGQTVSYLENTLDFGVCNLGNAGCLGYCRDYNWGDSKFSCASFSGAKINLNKQAESCDEGSQGCREFIRLNPGGGANLLINSDFEEALDKGGWSGFGQLSDTAFQGSHSLQKTKVKQAARHAIAVGGAGYNIAGESYTLSFYAKDCVEDDSASLGEKSLNLAAGAAWTRHDLTYTYPSGINTNQISFAINSADCLIDNIKLERGGRATNYSDYATGPSLIHEKLLPNYLADSSDGIQGACYELAGGSYGLKSGAPARCSDFARRCTADEAGCELYTGAESGVKIPAKVTAADYCPAECVGYNQFVQSETVFENKRDSYFIPKTARACSAEAAGCDQFTNLDEVKKGGEGIEYYSYLRQCLKPNTPGKICAEFYTWEGSDESGFQLKVDSLQVDDVHNSGLEQEPELSSNDNGLCNQEIYNLPPSHPRHNADCRQLYNRQGGVSYHLQSRTISCTDNCHPYRRTEMNIDESITSDRNCAGADKHWDNASEQCVVCKNGGVWSEENNGCIYQAVPNQGITCSAGQNKCRQYVGNTGNDVRQIFTDDFAEGLGVWTGLDGSIIEPSNESIILGPDNKGHSLKVTAPAGGKAKAGRSLGSSVKRGKSYSLSFTAKAGAAAGLAVNLKLSNGGAAAAASNFAAPANLTADWQIFEINLVELDHEVSPGEILILEAVAAGADFYIDNITLTEIVDRYYLIKDSWKTPASCDQDLAGQPSPLYMLGCAAYQDRAGQTHNLKQFNQLCSESAAGCELMIDTKNSAGQGASFYKDGQSAANCDPLTETDCLKVPADDFIYAVYDPEKLCGAEEKGCEFLGQPYTYDNAAVYGGVYLKNNPDKYGRILCGADAVGCQIFSYGQGEKYFKDPGDQVCEWRQKAGKGPERGWDWFKKKVKRCDDGLGEGEVNGRIDGRVNADEPIENKICLTSADCSAVDGRQCKRDQDCPAFTKCSSGICRYACLADGRDYGCPTSADKTFGFGGLGNLVYQPSQDDNNVSWAGLCPPAESGCAEYLEPVSKFSANLIFNGQFQDLDNIQSTVDGWTKVGGDYEQSLTLEPRTAYRLARDKAAGELSLADCAEPCPTCAGGQAEVRLQELTNDNNLAEAASITVSRQNYNNSRIFYNSSNQKVNCVITVKDSSGAVELKPLIIDYQLGENLDKQSCNGRVDPGQGCVLFNERKQAGSGLADLSWDADATGKGQNPAGEPKEERDSNLILKVAPDRVCDKWLSCKSYIKDARGDNVCFDLGLCDAVDENGNCSNFLLSKKENQRLGGAGGLDPAQISNLSGYSKVGISGGQLKTDYYPLGAMEQAGEAASFANGGFEFYGSNLYPVGWVWGGQSAGQSWSANVFSVINNPVAAQSEGIGYAREGAAFLKLGSSYDAVSEPIDVIPRTDYVITAYINTINLKSGQARIDIVDKNYKAGDAALAGGSIAQDLGNDWQFQIGKFSSGAASQIKIRLYSSASGAAASQGNFYFDDVKIRPALNSRDNLDVIPKQAWYAPQSCRLYPKSDALACDYFEDSGKRQKGWPGYCLEYDRRPGNPNVCLLWYPIDKVKGDGLEEGAGYSGKMPAYYCLESTSPRTLNGQCYTFHQNNEIEIVLDKPYIVWDSANDTITLTEGGAGNTSTYGLSLRNYTDHKWSNMVQQSASSSASRPRIWDLSNDFGQISMFDAVKIKCVKGDGDNKNCECANFTSQQGIQSAVSCQTVAQTVNAVGNNKFWSSRVYLGSDYQVACNAENPQAGQICAYDSDAPPFGSIVPPAPSLYAYLNPYEWDSNLAENAPGNQPLFYVKAPSQNARMGQSVSKDQLKRLFAQSYGAWQWAEGQDSCVSVSAKAALPLYVYPSPGNSNWAAAANSGGSDIDFIIANVADGPGDRVVNDWTNAIAQQVEKGIKIYGYVDTNYRAKGGASVDSEVSRWREFYPQVSGISGIFFDRVTADSNPSNIAYYQARYDYIKNNVDAAWTVVINPGTSAVEAYMEVADVITMFESTYDNWKTRSFPAWMNNYPPEKFYAIIYGALTKSDMLNAVRLAKVRNFGRIFVTSSWSPSDPLPSYFSDEIAEINKQNSSICLNQTASSGIGHYIKSDNPAFGWGPPAQICKNQGGAVMTVRSNAPGDYSNAEADYCAIPPVISNIKIDGSSGNIELSNSQFVKLSFNSKVDSQQLPMVMYGVDWGDDTKTVVTGVEMRDKPDPAPADPANDGSPETIYHLYSYWDLKAKDNSGAQGADITCLDDCSTQFAGAGKAACCYVQPKVQIKDNWGWCSGGASINDCNQWQPFAGQVVVKEK